MFKFKRKKTLYRLEYLDLRNHTPEALKNIKAIDTVAVLILPENPDEEFIKAFSSIKCKTVASTISLPKEKKIIQYTGMQRIDKLKTDKDSVAFMCGMVLICDSENTPDCIFSGMVVKNKKADVNIIGGAIGMLFEMDFEADKVSFFTNNMSIDSDFIRNVGQDTFIFCGHTLDIESGVTEKEITEKNLKFFAGYQVKCDKDILGCVKSRAAAGYQVISR